MSTFRTFLERHGASKENPFGDRLECRHEEAECYRCGAYLGSLDQTGTLGRVSPDNSPQPDGRVRRKWWRLGWLSALAVAKDALAAESEEALQRRSIPKVKPDTTASGGSESPVNIDSGRRCQTITQWAQCVLCDGHDTDHAFLLR